MDATTHTIIAVVMLMAAYYVGRYFSKSSILDEVITSMLDNLEKDGFVSIKTNLVGEKELIPISEIVTEAIRKNN